MGVLDVFWSEWFWLVPGYTWEDMKNRPDSAIYQPQLRDMCWSVPLGLMLIGFRYLFERFIVTPVGYWLGIKKKKQPVIADNPVLEKVFLRYGKQANNNLESIGKQTDMSVREMQIWLRDREILAKPEPIKKFKDSVWHFTFYLTSFTYGLVVLWNKPWFWESKLCWKGWPTLDVPTDIYVYYLVELAFYWSLVLTMLSDHKRKDFGQMIVHHVATITLMVFSWVVNYVRIGTLVLICHDAADIPLALGKICTYLRRKSASQFWLYVFIIVWILSRLAYYPAVVIYSSLVEIYEFYELSPAQRLFQGLLIVLQILHVIWTYMIARIAVINMRKGEVEDVRSDSDSD